MEKNYRIIKTGLIGGAIDISHKEDGSLYTVCVWDLPRIKADALAVDICALLNSGKYDKEKT